MSSTSKSFKPHLIFERKPGKSSYFVENLDQKTGLDMTFVPAGTFMMGCSENEPENNENEGPQHLVNVQSFFMGTYPVTQEQWRFVASLEQVDHTLEPEPSNLKGDKHPIEQVSWEDAIEFCKRLSNHTKRKYRLPSEAEWEYACRAKTTTPFHFGPTITTDYANYCGDGSTGGLPFYDPGPSGTYRAKTTPVDKFDVSNAFGLFDMHGNVWEWCQDPWHDNYEDAPNDGSVWGKDVLKDQRNLFILRGGSWFDPPYKCRSAYRDCRYPSIVDRNIGFRVVISAPGISSY